jgi:hypothetical protein
MRQEIAQNPALLDHRVREFGPAITTIQDPTGHVNTEGTLGPSAGDHTNPHVCAKQSGASTVKGLRRRSESSSRSIFLGESAVQLCNEKPELPGVLFS